MTNSQNSPGDSPADSPGALQAAEAAVPRSSEGSAVSGSAGSAGSAGSPAPAGGNWLPELRRPIPRWLTVVAGVACVAVCVGLWWWATAGDAEDRLLLYSQLPSIRETIDYLPNLWDPAAPERHLWYNTKVSLGRVLLGFSLALVVGIPLGVAAGCFPVLQSALAPLILFGRNIPVAALTALVFALFGTGELQKVMFIFIACVAFILSDAISAVQEVGQRYVETALTLGASRLQIIFKVLVPLAMPMIFDSVRVLFGLAFGYIMLVEIIQEGQGAGGLGYMLNIARRRSRPEIMVIIVLTIPVVAWLIDQLLYAMQCLLFRWKYGREAENSAVLRFSRMALRLFWSSPDRAGS